MRITGLHITYLKVCRRKLWLFSNGIGMELDSNLVAEGKLLHEQSYPQRAEKWQEIAIDGIKVDHYDAVNGIVREIKKSKKMEAAHLAQIKYYIYVLRQNGIKADYGILEYPSTRQTQEVHLSEEDEKLIPQWEAEVINIIHSDECPPRIETQLCKNCAYFEFCYTEEIDES